MDEHLVFIGTYTSRGAAGIYRARLDPSTGTLRLVGRPEPVLDPSFLALHPRADRLYAVSELSRYRGLASGAVVELAFDRHSAALEPLREQPTGGVHPCHVVCHPGGRRLYAANYGSGSVAAFPLGEDGALAAADQVIQHEGSSVDQRRQQGPHAHGVFPDPGGRFLLVPDLGADRIVVYAVEADGRLTPSGAAQASPGAGPRHFAFHPDGVHGFAVNEMGCSVTAWRYDPARGALRGLETASTLPEGWSGRSTCAAVAVSADGRFVYASNRGHDSIAVFAWSGESLRQAAVAPSLGRTPRAFALDPSGRFLYAAHQDSGTVVTLRIDAESGALQPAGPVLEVPAPVCLLIVP